MSLTAHRTRPSITLAIVTMMALRVLILIILPITLQATHTGWFPNKAHSHHALLKLPRGGSSAAPATADTTPISEMSLDDRVQAAMRRLGLDNTVDGDIVDDNFQEEDNGIIESTLDCEGGVCALPTAAEDTIESSSISEASESISKQEESSHDMVAIATSIASEYDVPRDIVMAAIYSSFSGEGENMRIDEELARSIVKAEVEAISGVSEDCDEVKQLVSEGFDPFFSRRSLAFSDMNVDNARAILVADQEDEDAEQQEMKAKEVEESQQPMKTVTVDYPKDFDPTVAVSPPEPAQQQKPTPAKKEDVVFEGTTADLQKLVIESPVPVLLDIYADWCGPCKQLTPALEQIAINAGGMLRLVKINTDQQRQISSALMVTSLPTVFGIKDGRIMHMFMGMPRDETMLRNFLMGLMVPGQAFNPPVTSEEKTKYEELSSKLLKLGAAASFSFSARERLQNKILKDLDELVTVVSAGDKESTTGMAVADDTARVLRSLMSNVIRNPFEVKFRTIKLDNKVIAAKVAKYAPCLSILRSIGFAQDGESILTVAKGKKVVNIAPFVTGRDMIGKWIDKNRYQIAAANRKRKDEIERVRLAVESEQIAKNEADFSEPEKIEDEANTICRMKVRVEGKKKVHDIKCEEDNSLTDLLAKLPFSIEDDEIVQFTCAAKRLIVKSTDNETMQKTLAQLNLTPTASIVLKIGEGRTDFSKGSLAERASSTQKKKTGSHSMHSIGLYAKDDGNKAEMFDGGGGVMYEHDISDDEGENEERNIEEHAPDEEMTNDDDDDDDDASNNSD